MKIILTILAIFILVGAAGGYFLYQRLTTEPPLGTGTLTINDTTISIEIARTAEQHNLGLSYRESLDENTGMLFVYDTLVLPSFWMYGMNFPLDIIWIRDDEIIGIEANVLAPEDPTNPQEMYRPERAVTATLEVNAGWTETHGVEVGDKVEVKTLDS